MDEKELVKRTKNSFRAKKSRAEILKGFQKKGYKLEYAEEIIKKAKKPQKVFVFSMLSFIILLLAALTSYSLFFDDYSTNLSNPLDGLSVITGNVVSSPPTSGSSTNSLLPNHQTQTNISSNTSSNQVTVEDIKITPDFISYLLQEIGASKLHRNPLTLEKPIINFKIDDKIFYSEIGREINTQEGLKEDADLQFNTKKPDLIHALKSDNPEAVFKNSLQNGDTQVELIASQPELFSKGYLSLYDSLK